ncbi:MAG: DUF1800 domain-containing protein [Bacteroidota bacterium]|nr:DUF1800 domain-containing protein [Bacteroidota bacterium]MDP4233196.1 DUF1800 domain-containing protein [Bacteroidota bacterium]MDP4242185.1 DUF1800 domain-containing protein [Bacteroidota bacterium]MDP4287836.1 DUF1800 domain-containing protein [Bacteroidota bacterium]
MSQTAISRRGFLTAWKPSSSKNRLAPLTSGLDPFVPDANSPWDAYRAGHLLRRTMMGPTWADIQTLLTHADPGTAVDLLLSGTTSPTPPAAANDQTENPYPLAIQAQYGIFGQWAADAAALRAWWSALQLNAQTSIQEKMTFFWSSHFTTQFDLGNLDYTIAPLLYRQNELFRSNALGNFQDLVKAVTLDGAMLIFLGGNENSGSHPNENYARELMELYTCGLGQYTEGDVQQAAKILSGWRVGQYTDAPAPHGIFNTYFSPADHDTSGKTYLGQQFPPIDTSTNTEFLVKKNEIDRLVDVLFAQRSPAIATFLSTKLYRFFVYSDPASVDQTVVAAMAALLIQSNWEIKPVISALLKSAHFFDNANLGAQIKSPAEYVIGMAKQLVASYPVDANMTAIGQQLFQPPNVSGWTGYHDWITTNTYPIRGTQASAVIQTLDDASAIAFIKQFANYTDANALVTQIGQLLLPRPLSTERQTTFASKLTAGAPVYEWASILNGSDATAARNLRDLLSDMASLPDFELC